MMGMFLGAIPGFSLPSFPFFASCLPWCEQLHPHVPTAMTCLPGCEQLYLHVPTAMTSVCLLIVCYHGFRIDKAKNCGLTCLKPQARMNSYFHKLYLLGVSS